MKKTCKEAGCHARVWQGELCSYHALQVLRATMKQKARRRVREDRHAVLHDAGRLGLSLEGQPAVRVVAPRRARARRSPVG